MHFQGRAGEGRAKSDQRRNVEIRKRIAGIPRKSCSDEGSRGRSEGTRGNAKQADDRFQEAFLSIPNIPHESVPDGKSEDDNQVVSTWGEVEGDFPNALPHYDIPWFDQLIDFPRGVKVVGAGFPFYLGQMSQLVRALINFFLEEGGANGYREVHSPIVVNAASATATGQLPDKEGQMYLDQNEDAYLIPTAEVPVTNFFRDEILSLEDLPVKRVAYTPCFRREAGSWAKTCVDSTDSISLTRSNS